jgi:hypothetical protein
VKLFYRTYDAKGKEKIKLKNKPSGILRENKPMIENKKGEGFEWQQMTGGGVLTIRRENSRKIVVLK